MLCESDCARSSWTCFSDVIHCLSAVPATVKLSIGTVDDTRFLTWDKASNMCPVSNYSVQNQLVYRDQCQPISDTFINVDTVDAETFSFPWSKPGGGSPYLPYSTYKIRVRAINEAGLGNFDSVTGDEFTTDEGCKYL